MTMRTIHDTVLAGSIGTLLDALNDAEAHVGRQELSFPRIAVIGDESAGKSSLLESLCKIPFPRGSTLTTKCPTQVRLRRKRGAEWSGKGWTPGDEVDRKNFETAVRREEQITEVVRDLQAKELIRIKELSRRETMFAAGPITISIEADDVADLTLVDLPGYFMRTGNIISGDEADVEWSSREVKRVSEILLDYVEDDKTILLVVLPVGTQFKTAGIMKLLEDYKARLQDQAKIQRLNSRIIYCVTKCDKYKDVGDEREAPPQQVEQLLRNEGNFSSKPHGWYFVINYAESQSQTQDFRSRIAAYREYETNFFDTTEPYCQLEHRGRCGTENLLHKLTHVLESEIRQNLRGMLANTETALAAARDELKYLGPPPAKQEFREREFHRIVQRIKLHYEQICDGKYHELRGRAEVAAPEKISSAELDKCKFGYTKYLRFQEFKKEIEATCKRFDDDEYRRKLEQRVREAKNGILEPVMVIPEVLYNEIRAFISPWKELAETLCDDIASYAMTCLEIIVDIEAGKYKRLPDVLKVYLQHLIHEQKNKALLRLRWNHVDEIARPNSLNQSWVEKVFAPEEKPRRDSISQMMESGSHAAAAAYLTRLKAYFPVAQIRYVDNVVRTISTHILDVPRGEGRTVVEGEEEPKYFFQGSEIYKGKSLDDLMKFKDDIERRRNAVTSRIQVLQTLRQAIRDQPDEIPNSVVNGPL